MRRLLFVAIFAALFFSGCVDKTPLPVEFKQGKTIKLLASEILVLDKTKPIDQRVVVLSDSEHYIPWFNEQLKNEVKKVVKSTMIVSKGESKIVVNIQTSSIRQTLKGIKTVPFAGIFALGMDEDVIANISLLIEIENKDGRVIASAPISVETRTKSTLLTEEEVRFASSKVMSDALQNLQNEISRQSSRLLYEYLAHN